MLGNDFEIAINLLNHLKNGDVLKIKELSAAIRAPMSSTRLVAHRLQRAGYLTSSRGRQGGIKRSSIEPISLIEITRALNKHMVKRDCDKKSTQFHNAIVSFLTKASV
jgi:DNA-binding IscR family transcriptional regulator